MFLDKAIPKEEVEKHEIVKIKETLFNMQICTTIPPDKKDTINERLISTGLNVSGTSLSWVLDEKFEPVKCGEFENRWHYICKC